MRHPCIRVAHRGTPREYPGNTLRSFQRALELGCEMLECDIRRAADGVCVLSHDPQIRDTYGNQYTIANETSALLASLDLGSGEGVPTLEELVAWSSGKCALMADMKCEGDGVEGLVAKTLAPLSSDVKLVPGASAMSRTRFRESDPLLPLSLTLSVSEESLLADPGFENLLASLDTEAVTWEHPLLTAERITALHQRNIRVFAWTVDSEETMWRLIHAGIDGIISNRPDLLTELAKG